MKIYRNGYKDRNGFLMVQPGRQYPHVKAWMTEERSESGEMKPVAVTFNLKFNDGVCEVNRELGEYCVDSELATRAPSSEPLVEVAPAFNEIRPNTVIFNS